MREWQDFEHPAFNNLVEHVARDQCAECVEDGLSPWVHLFALVARQIAEFLAADGIQRTEHDNLLVLLALEHHLQTGAQREG